MRVLLDTHVLLWVMGDIERLSARARDVVEDPRNDVFVSAVSAWEMGIKSAIGKLRVPDDLTEKIRASDFVTLPVTFEDGLAVASLPRLHDDPFDRLLVVQALSRQLLLMTADRRLHGYGVECLSAA